MGWVISILARWGLPESLRRPLAYLTAAIVLAGLLWAVWAYLSARENADDRHNQDVGAAVEREKAQSEVIKHVEEAADARNENSNRTDDQRRADCMRRSRTPQNCR